MTWPEIAWLMCTGTGLAVSLVVLDTSIMNWRLLRALGINSVRQYMAGTEVLRNLLLSGAQGLFFLAGVLAATEVHIPHVFPGIFVVAAGLLALATLLGLVRFEHVLDQMREEG